MRLAILRQRYTPFGGAERFIERALAALRAQGASVTVIAREWSGDAGGVVTCDPFYLGRLWRDWSFARAACRAAASASFDLVQSHERIACCDVYRAGDGVHAQWLANRGAALGPLGRLAIALNPYHRYVLAAERRLFASPRLRAVICNSRMVKDEIRRHFGVPEEKLHVIYNGIDLGAFHPSLREAHRAAVRAALEIPPEAFVLLFVGGGFERKGVFRLLEAFCDARREDAHLVVVGGDRAMERAKAAALSLGVAARVHFAGEQKDVRPFYGAADCFALPSLYDPFPNAALEAMACGLPPIVSRQCGTAELIEEGANGFVVDALAVDALAGTIAGLDAARTRDMGRRARASAEALGLDAMTGRLLALYRKLLSARSA